LNDLEKIKWPDYIKAVLNDISLCVLHSDFEKAAETADNTAMGINFHQN
jgi:hypothetical protein